MQHQVDPSGDTSAADATTIFHEEPVFKLLRVRGSHY